MKRFSLIGLLLCFVGLPVLGHAQVCASETECLTAYDAAILSRDTPADFEAAGEALRLGCALSETGESCRTLSWMIKEQVVPGKQGERAGLHLRACAQGDDIACNWLAEATLTLDAWNAPRDRDYTQARQLIEADCASGNDYTCRKLVRYVSHEDAEKYLAKCETGQTLFCALVAGGDFYPFHDTSQAPRVEETWRGLCESGEGMACIFLADLISSGHGRDVFETQRAHMERACDLGIAHGCNVARDYMLVEVPDADRATRMRYLQPSCEAGYARACQLIARLKRLDDDSSFIHYAEVLHLDCLAGGWRSCEAAAPVFHELRFKLNLSERYEDVDQYIQNYFDLAAALKRSLPVVFR